MSAGRALITGATGMIGTALAARLQRDGWTVNALTRADFSDANALDAAVRAAQSSVVFHLAGPPFNPPPPLNVFLDATVNNTAALLRALDEAGNDARIVFASSAAVYANASHAPEAQALAPATWLGAVKAMAEVLLAAAGRKTGRPIVVLRLYTPYGPAERTERLIPSLIDAARNQRPIPLSDGKQERDYVYVDDVVDAFVAAAGVAAPAPLVFNIGSGTGSSIREVVRMVLNLLDAAELAQFGALPTRTDEIMHMAADISAAQAVLAWTPRIPLQEGLRSTIQWYMNDSMHRV
jgi:UDP-glucose 4-epimerase